MTGFFLTQSQRQGGPHEDLANSPSLHKEKANRADLLGGSLSDQIYSASRWKMSISNPEETAVLLEKYPAGSIFQNKGSPGCVGLERILKG